MEGLSLLFTKPVKLMKLGCRMGWAVGRDRGCGGVRPKLGNLEQGSRGVEVWGRGLGAGVEL